MHWTVAAPFFDFDEQELQNCRWLDDFVVGDRHSFTKVPCRDNSTNKSWHHRLSRNTSMSGWLKYWHQSGEAWEKTTGGVITVFPQLATMVGTRKRFSSKNIPLISYCFNIGFLYSGVKQLLAKSALYDVDKFIVHSRKECETVSSWLGIPQSKFEFIPLQRAEIPITESEDIENPFILSMGSANRDYQTFFRCCGENRY
ncbi:hypothetical protein [Geminocystis sp.]|uniref:hypothetical protein n=1 Tax=Geminocystis sp. TaxID=2664100 RepID=UPI0035933BD6